MTSWSRTLVAACSYVEISKSVHGNQAREAKMTVHTGFINFSKAVNTADDVFS